jgi:hypothetical protein
VLANQVHEEAFMPRTSLLLTLILCAAGTAVHAANREIIPAGMLLQCTVSEPNFSSKTAMIGDPVLCHLGTLGEFGHSVFPRGAELGGHLEDAKAPGHFVGKGWMQVEFDHLILPGAQVYPLSAKVVSGPHVNVDAEGRLHGKGHAKRDIAGWMFPPLWPIKVITLPFRGPYPALKGETRLSLRLMEDVEVPFPVAGNVPMPPWANPSSYHSSSDGVYRPASTSYQRPTEAQPAYYTQRQTDAPPLVSAQPATEQPMTVIAMAGGAAFLAREYWVQDGQLHCVAADGQQKVFPLEKMDLYNTVSVNRQRNVEFVLQSKGGAVEQ